VPTISAEAQGFLTRHDYTGNIRELRSILLRALLFRQGPIITGEDLQRALASGHQPVVSENTEQDPVRRIQRALQEGDGDFWSLVHRPFIDNQLTRDTVCALIDVTRRDGARNMPDIAAALRACEPHPQNADEQRRFYKFKNFLYKTVRI
jgi:DNA-binding NtrC family response regulator